jgi:hypothetical protein
MAETPRVLRRLASQDVARANAAAAAEQLRRQRQEREEVDAYVARRWRYTSAVEVARRLSSSAD